MSQDDGLRVSEQALAEQKKRAKRERAAEKPRKKILDPSNKKPNRVVILDTGQYNFGLDIMIGSTLIVASKTSECRQSK